MSPDIFLPNAFNERLAYFEEHRNEICEFYAREKIKKAIDEDFEKIFELWQIDMPTKI